MSRFLLQIIGIIRELAKLFVHLPHILIKITSNEKNFIQYRSNGNTRRLWQ